MGKIQDNLLLFGCTILFLFFLLISVITIMSNIRKYEEVPGTVTSANCETNWEKPNKFSKSVIKVPVTRCELKVRYKYENKEHEGFINGEKNKNYSEGDSVIISVNTMYPDNIMRKGERYNKIAMGTIGLIFSLIGIGFFVSIIRDELIELYTGKNE